MNEKIENIIKNKSYIELNQQEKDSIKEWAGDEEAFNQLKLMLLSSAQLLENEKEELNPTIKQRLDVRFAEKHNRTRLVWYNSLWTFFWPVDGSFVRKPLIQLAAVGVVVALTVPFLTQQSPIEKPLVAKVEVVKNDDDSMLGKPEQEKLSENQNKVEDKDMDISEAEPTEKSNEVVILQQDEPEIQGPAPIDNRLTVDHLDIAQKEKKEMSEESIEIAQDIAVVESEKRTDETSVEMLSNPSLNFKQLQGTVTFDSQSANIGKQGLNNLTIKKSKKVNVEETLVLLTALY